MMMMIMIMIMIMIMMRAQKHPRNHAGKQANPIVCLENLHSGDVCTAASRHCCHQYWFTLLFSVPPPLAQKKNNSVPRN